MLPNISSSLAHSLPLIISFVNFAQVAPPFVYRQHSLSNSPQNCFNLILSRLKEAPLSCQPFRRLNVGISSEVPHAVGAQTKPSLLTRPRHQCSQAAMGGHRHLGRLGDFLLEPFRMPLARGQHRTCKSFIIHRWPFAETNTIY